MKPNKTDIAPEYVRAVEQMVALIRSDVGQGHAPEFMMPPEHILFAAPLDVMEERVCANEDARWLVLVLCRFVRGIEDDGPTVFMLRCALRLAGVAYETKPIEHFTQGMKIAGFPQPGGKS